MSPNQFRASTRTVVLAGAILMSLAGAATAEDWRKLSGKDWASIVSGNTVSEDSGRWSVYYAPDGRKIVLIHGNGNRADRKWWVSDKGEWCATMYRDDAEKCSAETEHEVRGNEMRKTASYGGTDWTAKIRKGNPENL